MQTTFTAPIDEAVLRQRLGIPTDAQRVLLFAESSHWDPNWLRTSQEYFQQLVAPGLEQAVQELQDDPRRVFSIECMFFLRMFWESRPDLHEMLRELLNSRRLRLTGSGVTTPDTLIPSDEAILRDMLIGQEWLRSVGVTQEPRLAYFPDCFGHSPNLPSLLNAAGFDRTAVTRIDGMWFISADLDLPSNFPLHGSSAERLLKQEHCLDFTWLAGDGSQVLCHWNAFTYGQGDLLADSGSARVYLFPTLSRPNRSEKVIVRRVNSFMRQLSPLTRTPYLFCPIGWDFNPPIPALGELLDRYNRNIYPTSGVWLVNAGLDDYFDLIEHYREKLPVFAMDPNPYWTGFYTSRPSLKQRAFKLGERLSLIEQLSLLQNGSILQPPGASEPPSELSPAPDFISDWWPVAVANHHDFITGTSPDRVAYGEQIPMLDEALEQSRRTLQKLAGQADLPISTTTGSLGTLPECTRQGLDLKICTAHYQVNLSADDGGRLEQLHLTDSDQPLLEGQAHQIIQYNESGGLWRMGYEYRGGRFDRAQIHLPAAQFDVQDQGATLRVTWQTMLPGASLNQTLWMSQDDPLLYFEVEGLAPQKSTLVVNYRLPFRPRDLIMEAPGGVITRQPTRVFARTFWPVQRYVYIPHPDGRRGFAALLRFPGAVSVDADGQVEIITQRNAIREKAYWNLFNLLGMPATGIERERTSFRFAVAFPRPEQADLLPALARGLVTAPWSSAEERLSVQSAARLVQVDSDQVFVSAIKPAWRGDGIILRLSASQAPLGPVRVHCLGMHPQRAWLCDARERDLRPLEIDGQALQVPIDRSMVTLRLV